MQFKNADANMLGLEGRFLLLQNAKQGDQTLCPVFYFYIDLWVLNRGTQPWIGSAVIKHTKTSSALKEVQVHAEDRLSDRYHPVGPRSEA